MRVLYHNRNRMPQEIEQTYKAMYIDLGTLLKQPDFATLHVLLTNSLHHLIDQDKLSLVRLTAYLINIALGAVIDEQALVEVLRQRKIAGAAINVCEKELELSPGLQELDNAILIPHLGSAAQQT